MERIIYTNGMGESQTFEYRDASRILHNFTDIQSVNNWTTTGYNQHGATYIKSLMNERTIELSFWVIGNTLNEFYERRETMFHLFNPMLGLGTLDYSNNVVNRTLDVYIDTMPQEIENYGNGRLYKVILRAANPFYRDKTLNGIQFANGFGGIIFSLVFSPDETFGWDRRSALVTNAGDIPTPVSITIRNAEMTNPRIILDNGQYIGIEKHIAADEEVKITTDYGNKQILINGLPADKYLMSGSTWIQLPVGTTRVTCAVEEGTPDVYLTWYNRYLGV